MKITDKMIDEMTEKLKKEFKITDRIIDEIENDLSWEEDGEFGHDEEHAKIAPKFHFSLPTVNMGIGKKDDDEKSFVKGYN